MIASGEITTILKRCGFRCARRSTPFHDGRSEHTPVRLRSQCLSLLVSLWIPAVTSAERPLTTEELVLRAKPAVVLVTTRVSAEVIVNCGRGGTIIVTPPPYVETGTAWFVDGRGYLITNAHVVDPAYRPLPWVTEELKRRALGRACTGEPGPPGSGRMHGQHRQTQIRNRINAVSLGMTRDPHVYVQLSNGAVLSAEIVKVSLPLLLHASGKPTSDSGRDLALLRVKGGAYPALGLADARLKIGQPVHIVGFPGVVLNDQLLSQSARLEASVTTGSVSGFKQNAIGQNLIQTDASAAPGHSGGPAMGPRGGVAGVLTAISLSETDGGLIQGFNFLIPARDINEFLQGTEVVQPGESCFSSIWEDGLRELRSERFKRASALFAEADRLLPGLVDVKRALTEADDGLKHRSAQRHLWSWIVAEISVPGAGGWGVPWYQRRRESC